MNKKSLPYIVAAFMLAFTHSAFAGLIEVDYIVYSDEPVYTGSFAGYDNNSNGLLENGELISFTNSYWDATYGDLLDNGWVDFGDFDILTNTWTPNAIDWTSNYNAYFTWDNQDNSWNTSWIDSITTTITSTEVPEPSTFAIFALGMLGLISRKNKK